MSSEASPQVSALGSSRSRIRRIAFTAWAASLAVVFGIGFFGLVSLVLGWFQSVEGVAGPVTDLGYGALVGIILTMAVVVQLHAPERKIAGVQQAALVIPTLLVGSAVASDSQDVVSALIVMPTVGILLALHPAFAVSRRPGEDVRRNPVVGSIGDGAVPVTEPTSEHPARDPEVFYDLARDRLTVQLETVDALDNKIGLLFSTSSGLLGILAAALVLKEGELGWVEYVGVAASLGAYGFVSWQSARAYRARDWFTGPDLAQVYRRYTEPGDDRALKWEIGNRLRLDTVRNQDSMTRKSTALRLILPAVMFQSLILVLALVLVAAGV